MIPTKKTLDYNPWIVFVTFCGALLIYALSVEMGQIFLFISTLILCLVIFGWLVSLGIGLNRNLPESDQSSETIFLLSGFYCPTIILLAAIDSGSLLTELKGEYLGIILILFFLSFFYLLYYDSVVFISNQEKYLNREDRTKPEIVFILFIVFIVGVLVLQGKIRKINQSANR